MSSTTERPSLIQHEVRPAVKRWIEEEARKQERSQRWFMNKLVEDAYARAQSGQSPCAAGVKDGP